MFLKLLLSFIFAIAPTQDGWFPVEKVPPAEEVVTDVDPTLWVLFLKKLGDESVALRFPGDPIYHTTRDGGFIARAHGGSETFELTVREGNSALSEDRTYSLDGRWIHEHFIHTPTHTFLLRTYSLLPVSPNHDTFISSFSFQ